MTSNEQQVILVSTRYKRNSIYGQLLYGYIVYTVYHIGLCKIIVFILNRVLNTLQIINKIITNYYYLKICYTLYYTIKQILEQFVRKLSSIDCSK